MASYAVIASGAAAVVFFSINGALVAQQSVESCTHYDYTCVAAGLVLGATSPRLHASPLCVYAVTSAYTAAVLLFKGTTCCYARRYYSSGLDGNMFDVTMASVYAAEHMNIVWLKVWYAVVVTLHLNSSASVHSTCPIFCLKTLVLIAVKMVAACVVSTMLVMMTGVSIYP